MKDGVKAAPDSPAAEQSKPKGKPGNAMSRIKLALLDQYSQDSESHGGDPYNTNKNGSADQWRGNARRI